MKNFVRINSELSNFNSVVNIPGDKSISIRWILLASQALGPSRAYNLLESDDVKNTINSIKKIGVQIKKKKRELCAPPAPPEGLYLEKVFY